MNHSTRFLDLLYTNYPQVSVVQLTSFWLYDVVKTLGGFPYFLQFKSEFCYKEFMIWATVSSRSGLCWLYRTFPSSAAKNIINKEQFVVDFNEKGVYYDQHILLTLLALALLHFVLQGQTCLLLQVSPDFLLLHSIPLWWKGHLFWGGWVLVIEGLVGLHRTLQLQLL